MNLTFALGIYLLFGLLVVKICLRYESDDLESLDELRRAMPAAYVFVILFGAVLWPFTLHNTIRRARHRRRAAKKPEDNPVFQLVPVEELPEPGEFLCAIPCPQCQGPAKLCKPDERTRGWYRVTCAKGHWGDLRTDSILIPEQHRVPWEGS